MRTIVIITALLVVISLAGCIGGPGFAGKVPVAHRTHLEKGALAVEELAARCEAGDAEACRVGCLKANELLQAFINGMYGVVTEPDSQ